MSLFKGLILTFLAYFLLIGAALADHMTGQYSGTGQVQGTNLVIQQSGRTVSGQFSGTTNGTLNGQSDGGENVTGTISLANGQQFQFQALHSQQGLQIRVSDGQGSEDYLFVRGAGTGDTTTPRPQPQPQPQPPQPQPTPQPPPAPQPPQPPPLPADAAEYFVGVNGQQIGPVTRQQILAALAAGEVSMNDLVWKQGMPNWVPIGTMPEFTAPPPYTTNGPPPLPPDNNGAPGPLTDNKKGPNGPLNPEQVKISAIMMGSAYGVFAHELGHALIGELGIPATGSEEDTVDEFSALALSSMLLDTSGMDAATVSFFTDLISYSTLLWYHDAERSRQQGQQIPWYDEHSSGEARFRNTLCMIYGSSPTHFKALADRVQFPDRERGRCEVDYAKRARAWELIVQPYARYSEGEYPGMQPADAKGGKLTVTYQPSASAFGQQLQADLQNVQLFENLAAMFEQIVVWPRDLSIIFADCGTPNAFYDPQNAQIVMCWEGVEFFFWTVAEPEGISKARYQPGLRMTP